MYLNNILCTSQGWWFGFDLQLVIFHAWINRVPLVLPSIQVSMLAGSLCASFEGRDLDPGRWVDGAASTSVIYNSGHLGRTVNNWSIIKNRVLTQSCCVGLDLENQQQKLLPQTEA